MSINVNEGITREGERDSAFDPDVLLAQKQARDQTQASHSPDVGSTPDGIRAALLSPDEGSVKHGLTGPPTEYERLVADPEFQANVAEGRRLSEADRLDRAELEMRREGDFRAQAFTILSVPDEWGDYAHSPEDRAWAWAALSDEAKQEALDADFVQEWEVEELERDSQLLTRQSELEQREAHLVAAEARQQLETALAINRVAQENGWTVAEASAWTARTNQTLREGGLTAPTVAGYEGAMRATVAAHREETRASHEASFKQQVLNATSTDIASGLTMASPWGHVPVNPSPQIQPRPDWGKIMPDAARRETDEDIRNSVRSEPSARDEYRRVQEVGGRLFEAEQERRLAQARR